MLASNELLDRLLDPVGRALSPEAARRLIALRADDDLQAKIDDLADRANEGTLTDDERTDYESLVATATVIAILQSKARAIPVRNPGGLGMPLDADLRNFVREEPVAAANIAMLPRSRIRSFGSTASTSSRASTVVRRSKAILRGPAITAICTKAPTSAASIRQTVT